MHFLETGQTTDAVIRTVEVVRDQKAEMKKIEMAVTKIVAVAIGTAEDVTTGNDKCWTMPNISAFNFVMLKFSDREADRRHLDVSKHRNKSKVYIIMDYSFIFYFSFVWFQKFEMIIKNITLS